MFDETNVQIFGKRLAVLADVLGGRAPASREAVEVWTDALRGIPLSYAIAAVNRWASHHNKFPTPADIRKAAEEDFLRDQERREQELQDNAPRISDVRPADPALAEAVREWRQWPRPHQPDKYNLKRNLVLWQSGAKISEFGERTLRETFGDEPRRDIVEQARREVEAYEAAVAAIPKPSQLLGNNRAQWRQR